MADEGGETSRTSGRAERCSGSGCDGPWSRRSAALASSVRISASRRAGRMGRQSSRARGGEGWRPRGRGASGLGRTFTLLAPRGVRGPQERALREPPAEQPTHFGLVPPQRGGGRLHGGATCSATGRHPPLRKILRRQSITTRALAMTPARATKPRLFLVADAVGAPHGSARARAVVAMGNPPPDPIVLRGHGAEVQCVSFATVDGVDCLLSGYAASARIPRRPPFVAHPTTFLPPGPALTLSPRRPTSAAIATAT